MIPLRQHALRDRSLLSLVPPRRFRRVSNGKTQRVTLLPAGRHDAGIRTLGGSWVSGARQHPHPHRGRQQCSGLRHRLLRAFATRRDRTAAAAVRSSAGELRAHRRQLPGRGGRTRTDRRQAYDRRGGRDRPPRAAEGGSGRRSPIVVTVRVSEAQIVEAPLGLARTGLYAEPTNATVAAAYADLLRRTVISPDETTALILTGTGSNSTQSVGEPLGLL